jgi:hypothetical protein
MKFHEKLNAAPSASFHVLDPVKAKRMNGATLYIPSPNDVRAAIDAIPHGEMNTIPELRRQLAKAGGADVACPAATIKYWKWMAFAAEVEGGQPLPWWRVTKDGKPSELLPGGIEVHREKLRSEAS